MAPGFPEMMMQPARHKCHACCLPLTNRLGFRLYNMHDDCVEVVAQSSEKFLKGSQFARYIRADVMMQWPQLEVEQVLV